MKLLVDTVDTTLPAVADRPKWYEMPASQRRAWAIVDQASKQKRKLGDALEDYTPVQPPNWPNAPVEHRCVGFINHVARGDRALYYFLFYLVWAAASFLIATTGRWIVGDVDPGRWGVSMLIMSLGFAVVSIPRYTLPCIWFAAPIPAGALRTYNKAKRSRLFDEFRVYSPHAEHFAHADALTSMSTRFLQAMAKDPLLLGRVGNHWFYIAGWNLSEDIEFVSDPSELFPTQRR